MAERMPSNVALGRAVQRWRLARGLTQKQLGERSGLSRKGVGELELAKVHPELATIEKVLEGSGLTLSELAELMEREAEAG